MRLISESAAKRFKECGIPIKTLYCLEVPASHILDDMILDFVEVPTNIVEKIKDLDADNEPDATTPASASNGDGDNVFTSTWGEKKYGEAFEATIRGEPGNKWWLVAGSRIPKVWPPYLSKPKWEKHRKIRDTLFASDKVDRHSEKEPFYTVLTDILMGARDAACAIAVGTVDSGREWTNNSGKDLVSWRNGL